MTLKHRAQMSNYPHLRGESSEYELLTSQLSYEPDRGLELQLPIGAWHARYRDRSQVLQDELEFFSDPRETTYHSYVKQQHARELAIDEVFRRIEELDSDRALPMSALAHLEKAIFPLRYLFHGFQMIAAYLGELAPNSRVAVASMFQAADELRRIQRIAQRMALARRIHPELGSDSRAVFEHAPEWQPARKLLEELLVTYEYDRAFIALNLCMKPIFDELVLVGAANVAGDRALREVFASLYEDALWQREWSLVFLRGAVDDAAREPARALIEHYLAQVESAISPLADYFGGKTWCAEILARWWERLRKEGV